MKTILVTGASSGIGARTAALLAQQGHRVYGVARRVEQVAQLPLVIPLPLDLRDDGSIQNVAQTVAGRGGVDILVNCAGYGEFGSVEDTTPEQAREQLEVNVLGPLALTRALLPGMRQQCSGRIVNVSSLAGDALASLRRFSDLSRKIYAFYFRRVAPGAQKTNELAKHTSEIRYIFGTLTPAEYYNQTDKAVSDEIQYAWTTFATTGRPLMANGTPWPAYDQNDPQWTVIDEQMVGKAIQLPEILELINALRG